MTLTSFEYLRLDELRDSAEQQNATFSAAKPFRHLVFDGLVKPERLATLADEFPDPEWPGWNDVDHAFQRYKRACSDVSVMPQHVRNLVYELNSGPFLNYLSSVTGIPQLLPDPHLNGGGMHMTTEGGTLTPHTDFHTVRGNPLFRRLNLLLYLNPGWTDENNGNLELWDKKTDKIVEEVMPELGTCVIFQTDDVSVHGFSKPVTGRNRSSIAMYYYTAEDAEEFSGDTVTYWRVKNADSGGLAAKMRYAAYTMFSQAARVTSSLTWRLRAQAKRYQPAPHESIGAENH